MPAYLGGLDIGMITIYHLNALVSYSTAKASRCVPLASRALATVNNLCGRLLFNSALLCNPTAYFIWRDMRVIKYEAQEIIAVVRQMAFETPTFSQGPGAGYAYKPRGDIGKTREL